MAKTENQKNIKPSTSDHGLTRLVIRDLDTGLFLANGKWAGEASLAQAFPDLDAIEKIVAEQRIQNAEMVLLEGPKHRVRGGARIPPPSPSR